MTVYEYMMQENDRVLPVLSRYVRVSLYGEKRKSKRNLMKKIKPSAHTDVHTLILHTNTCVYAIWVKGGPRTDKQCD